MVWRQIVVVVIVIVVDVITAKFSKLALVGGKLQTPPSRSAPRLSSFRDLRRLEKNSPPSASLVRPSPHRLGPPTLEHVREENEGGKRKVERKERGAIEHGINK